MAVKQIVGRERRGAPSQLNYAAKIALMPPRQLKRPPDTHLAMDQELITISERHSVHSNQTGLIISAVRTFNDRAEIVVGRPGLPNLEVTLGVGGATLFETPNGMFEVRVLTTYLTQVQVLVTKISPRPGIAAGYVDQDPENTPFLPEELARIAANIEEIKTAMSDQLDINTEQFHYLANRLDEMLGASERLGRKDWINYAIGTFTSIVVTAAFTDSAQTLFLRTCGGVFFWVFGTGFRLLTP